MTLRLSGPECLRRDLVSARAGEPVAGLSHRYNGDGEMPVFDTRSAAVSPVINCRSLITAAHSPTSHR